METRYLGEHQIFAQCQEVFFGERCSGGIYDASQQAIKQVS
jgi:hypothetical protein